MTDQPRKPGSASDDDDTLDYLDAGLSDDFDDGGARTEALPPPPEGGPQRVVRPGRDAAPATAVLAAEPESRDQSWTWPLINAAGLAVVVLVNYLANALEFNGQSTGDVVNQDPVPFQPAGWVFAIWGVIYALLLLFVIYGLLPGGRRNVRLRRVSPLFLLSNIANVTWIVLWHFEWFLASLVTILVLLGALLGIYIGFRIRNPIRRSAAGGPPWYLRLVVWAPFSVYLGWICVATLANLMVWLERSGWGGGPFSYNVWAMIFMAGGTVLAAAFAGVTRDVLIPLVFTVAYAGIVDQNWGEATSVSIAAILFAIVCASLAALAWIRTFDRDTSRNPFRRQAVAGNSSPMSHVDNPPSERA